MNKEEELYRMSMEVRTCLRCHLSETRHHALPGEGNANARLFLIAQAPGEVEDNVGNMFIGPSGEVLDDLFDIAGLDREKIYMTNLIKCMLPRNRRPKHGEIEACHHYLDREIDIVKPEFLVPLGHYATRHILNKYGKKTPPKNDFQRLYGKLLYLRQQKIYPLQHPAAQLHYETLKKVLEYNYRKLSVFKQPCKWYPMCPMKRYYERGELDRKWIDLYCNGNWEPCIRFQMKEMNKYHEDRMLPDGTSIEGGVR